MKTKTVGFHQEGFTIVEMLIVLSIIGLMTVMVMSRIRSGALIEARSASIAQSADELARAAATYALNHSLTSFLGQDNAYGGTGQNADVTLALLSAPSPTEEPYVSPLLAGAADANPFGGSYNLFPFWRDYYVSSTAGDLSAECAPGTNGMPQYDAGMVAVVATGIPEEAMPALTQNLGIKSAGFCRTSTGFLVILF